MQFYKQSVEHHLCPIASQRYERDYVLFIKSRRDLKHASTDAIHASHLSYKIDNLSEARYSTTDFIAVIMELYLI